MERISLILDGTIDDAILALSIEGLTVVAPAEMASLSFAGRFKNEPAELMLDSMAARMGDEARVIQRENVIYVGPPQDDDLGLAVYLVPSGTAEQWVNLYKLAASPSASVEARGDIVAVRDTPEAIARTKRFHAAISSGRRQYVAEIVLAELSEQEISALGIDSDLQGLAQLAIDGSLLNVGDLTQTASISATLSNAIFGNGSKDQTQRLQTVILHVMEGEAVRIQSGDQVNLRSRITTEFGVIEDAGFDEFNTGVIVSLTARSVDDEVVRLDIDAEVSAVADFIEGGPRITTRNIQSSAQIGIGGVVVLGGLRDESASEGNPLFPGTRLITGYNRSKATTRFYAFIRLHEAFQNVGNSEVGPSTPASDESERGV